MSPLESIKELGLELSSSEDNFIEDKCRVYARSIIRHAQKAQEDMAELEEIASKDRFWIECLEIAGYDNWEGYCYACETMREKYGDE